MLKFSWAENAYSFIVLPQIAQASCFNTVYFCLVPVTVCSSAGSKAYHMHTSMSSYACVFEKKSVKVNMVYHFFPAGKSTWSGSVDGSSYLLRKKKDKLRMSMPMTLAFCYLALLWLRESITLSDLLRYKQCIMKTPLILY